MVTATATGKRITVSRIHGRFEYFPSIKKASGIWAISERYAREDLGVFQVLAQAHARES